MRESKLLLSHAQSKLHSRVVNFNSNYCYYFNNCLSFCCGNWMFSNSVNLIPQKTMLHPKAPHKTPRSGICSRLCRYFRPELIEGLVFWVATFGISIYILKTLFSAAQKWLASYTLALFMLTMVHFAAMVAAGTVGGNQKNSLLAKKLTKPIL